MHHTYALHISPHSAIHHARRRSPRRPTSLDPTDSLQSAFGASGIQLCLWSLNRIRQFDADGDSRGAPFCQGGPNRHKRTGSPPPPFRTARTAVVVVLKGSLYRNALFMIVIIIIVMII